MSLPADQSATELLTNLFADAIGKRASDIHIEPQERSLRIRFRVDGLLTPYATLSTTQTGPLISRIKVISGLDIGQQRLPQDGRLNLSAQAGHKAAEFRVSTCPTLWGEKVVMRYMTPLDTLPSIEQLGMRKTQLHALQEALKSPWGLVLVTGPTGSGKTVTLYSALQALNGEGRNISTIEDPVEMCLPGINQVACHAEIGLGFPEALRAFLRQDPDVLMVGEIRDAVTAKMAIEAAQTGHLVFSTLHTNTAQATVLRLKHLGVSSHDLADSLRLVLSQSLMRMLHECKQLDHSAYAQRLTEEHPNSQIWKARGCSMCRSGYLGRVGVFESLIVSAAMREKLGEARQLTDRNWHTEQDQSMSLTDAALQHVLSGASSLSEYRRVSRRAALC